MSLCIREQLGGHSSNVSNALYAFDQACFEAFKFSQREGDQLLQECLRHMGGQLCFHLGTAWLRIGKQSRATGWKECTPYAWALLALAYSPPGTADLTCQNVKDKNRRHMKLWKEDAAFRCTQAGSVPKLPYVTSSKMVPYCNLFLIKLLPLSRSHPVKYAWRPTAGKVFPVQQW